MNDIEILNTVYSFSLNSIAKYVLDANPYYKEGEKKEAEEYLNKIIKIHDECVKLCEDFSVDNKIPLNHGTFNHEFAELNYLSFDFLKEYINKQIEREKEYIKLNSSDISISSSLKILLEKIKKLYE